MNKFLKHTGKVIPLDISNIDTDIIIPKQFLKKIDKNGFGKYLFYDWRYTDKKGTNLNKDFILNNQEYVNSTILLVRDNFGCGSSREHAVWALKDYGFKVIIGSSFSDIFYNNSLQNFILPIILSKDIINSLFDFFLNKIKFCTINLKKELIKINKTCFKFDIDPFNKFCLINGLDEIDMTMKNIKYIEEYESKDNLF